MPGLKSATVVSVMLQLPPEHCGVANAGRANDDAADGRTPIVSAEVVAVKNASPMPKASSARSRIRP